MSGMMYDDDSAMSTDGSGMMDSDDMTGNNSDDDGDGAGMMPGDQTTMPGSDTGETSPGNGMMGN